MQSGAPVSLEVAEKVAEQEETDPTELHPPLHTAIDPEALDALFQSTPATDRTDGIVTFQYKGYRVCVDSSGEVKIGETISSNKRSKPCNESVGD